MSELTIAIFWISAVILTAAILWVPRFGIMARWQARKAINQRETLEDALKLIFNLRQDGQEPDKYRLAVEMGLDRAAIQTLIERLEAQQLVIPDQEKLALTPSGQNWALQVIRAHRLWERYLADEARMPLEKIHTAAHHREHIMSPEEVNSLDAALGHPASDPHGDPIPSAAGKMRETQPNLHITMLKPGQRGRVVQLEDEPPLAYAQLLAEGLYIGQTVMVQENSSTRIVLNDEDNQYTLAHSIADNVYVHLVEPEAQPDPAVIPLGNLQTREEAEIVRIDERCQGFTRRRFLDLGLTPGTKIFPELDNAFKEPRAYRVRGTLIALRHEQAAQIWVRANNRNN